VISFLLQHGHEVTEAVEHAAEHEAHSGTPHLQNFVSWLAEITHNPVLADWINPIFSFSIMIVLVTVFGLTARNLKKEPGRWQNFVEMIFGALDNFVLDMLGPSGRKFVPLIGSLFIYILVMNLWGLFPFFGHSPSSNLNITISLAVFVFLTVQAHGIKSLGFLGYLKHFGDLPQHEKPSIIQIALSPLMFVLHIIGELAKPLSLSLRLFGNITGEDVLIAIFVTLVAFVPLHFFMYPIALLGSFIQALVFALLSTVYLMLMSPHEEH